VCVVIVGGGDLFRIPRWEKMSTRAKRLKPNEGERRVNIIHSAIQEVNTKKVAKRVLFWPEKGSHVYLHLAL
jgi:hypothetical protein